MSPTTASSTERRKTPCDTRTGIYRTGGHRDRLTGRVVSSGATTKITTPFTGEPLVELPVSERRRRRAAYERARAAQRAWAALPPEERAQPFLRFHDLVLDRRDEILDIVQLETGKARRHAFEEVARRRGLHARTTRAARPACSSRSAARASFRVADPGRSSCASPRASSALISPVELPAGARRHRRHPGAAGRQRRRPQARHPDRAVRAVGGRPAGRARAARRSSGRSSLGDPADGRRRR